MKWSVVVVLVGALGACTSDDAPAEDVDVAADTAPAPAADTIAEDPSSGPWAVSAHMFGSLRLGSTVAEASSAIDDAIDMSGYGVDFGACDYVRAPSMPDRTLLMVIDSTDVARVDVASTEVLTTRGVGVGSTEQEVIDAYRGRIRVEPHHYTGPAGHYLVYLAPDDTMFAVVFETDGTRVTTYRAGRQPEVMYVEGCA